jgi:hypothetical protein
MLLGAVLTRILLSAVTARRPPIERTVEMILRLLRPRPRPNRAAGQASGVITGQHPGQGEEHGKEPGRRARFRRWREVLWWQVLDSNQRRLADGFTDRYRPARSHGRSLQGVRSEPQIGEGPVEVAVQVVGTVGPPPADGDRIGVHAHLGAQGRERLGDAAAYQGIGERGD